MIGHRQGGYGSDFWSSVLLVMLNVSLWVLFVYILVAVWEAVS